MRSALLTSTLLMALSFVVLSCAQKPAGEDVFNSEFCPACHYFRGMGKEGGIDISRVGEYRSPDWIRQHIINPKSHNPNIGMPAHAHLSGAEVDALVSMLTSTMKETRKP